MTPLFSERQKQDLPVAEYLRHTHNAYGVDRTLLRERLKLTPTERILDHIKFMEFIEGLQKAKKINE